MSDSDNIESPEVDAPPEDVGPLIDNSEDAPEKATLYYDPDEAGETPEGLACAGEEGEDE
jgi:hypothetical protein